MQVEVPTTRPRTLAHMFYCKHHKIMNHTSPEEQHLQLRSSDTNTTDIDIGAVTKTS